jgi:acyl-CoA thioester hydrolase
MKRKDLVSNRIEAPFVTNIKNVLPEWIDYNDHMNVAYYTLAFDEALDDFLNEMGIGEMYVKSSQNGPYALQANYHYLNELLEGEEFRVRIFLVDVSDKCFHSAMELFNEKDLSVCAVCEQITMNVDLKIRKANNYPDWVREKFDMMLSSQKDKQLPAQIGKPIGLRH